MSDSRPRVSIGMPIYNGQQFAAQAIAALLSQTCDDFELIISDNASTDATADICRDWAARDPRIHYSRLEQNCGAARNFCRVFELARGQYFRWAAHDDLVAPTYLEHCLSVLEADDSVVLAYPQAAVIDGHGRVLADAQSNSREVDVSNVPYLESPSAATRLCGVLVHTLRCYEMFGLIRSDAMRRTRLHRPYPGAEKILLAELALQGRFQQIPETLFFSRRHADRFSTLRSTHSQVQWMSAGRQRRWVVPRHLRTSWGSLRAIVDMPLPWTEKIGCLASLTRYVTQWHKLGPAIAEACDGLGWPQRNGRERPARLPIASSVTSETVAANPRSQAVVDANEVDTALTGPNEPLPAKMAQGTGAELEVDRRLLSGVSVPSSAELAPLPDTLGPLGSIVIVQDTKPTTCCGKSTIVID